VANAVANAAAKALSRKQWASSLMSAGPLAFVSWSSLSCRGVWRGKPSNPAASDRRAAANGSADRGEGSEGVCGSAFEASAGHRGEASFLGPPAALVIDATVVTP